jgi:hypothetical protein
MPRSKLSLVSSRFKKVDGFINYISSWKRCYQCEGLRTASVKQLSDKAFDYVINSLLYEAKWGGVSGE